MGWLDRLLTWDEANDGTPKAAPYRRPGDKPWRMLGMKDRQLLDAIADGIWVHEDTLRRRLKWGRLRFFLTTLRMVEAGWIEAREVGNVLKSEYRLRPGGW
jgi:hypothetical protein